MNATDGDKLRRLLGYLENDPINADLLTDAVESALDIGDLDQAESLNARLIEVLPLDVRGPYYASMIAMKRGAFEQSAAVLERLLDEHDYPNIRFNLAWSKAMAGKKRDALAVIDDKTVEAIPAAAMLRVQLMHEHGDFDGAFAVAHHVMALHPTDQGLMAAIATLATDMEDMELARQCAELAGDHPEGLAVSGLIEFENGDIAAARRLYDRSISIRDHNPRAWVGRGLSALVENAPADAARDIDRGAQQFGDHIGSWIAAGWAHCLAGNREEARERFEHALAIDHNFAESHGSLAVIDVLSGNQDAARRRIVTALKLDRECFAAALAQVLLSSDDPTKAQQIVDQAMQTPLNEKGLTIATYMAGLAVRSGVTIH
jgi:tetratricopeptide (TPR) repeat protein